MADGEREVRVMMVVTEREGNEKESVGTPQETDEADGWRSKTLEPVFRKEEEADEKLTGDSPGAGTVFVRLHPYTYNKCVREHRLVLMTVVLLFQFPCFDRW